MSGGSLDDYGYDRINDTVCAIDRIVAENEDSTENGYGERRGHFYSPETIAKLKFASEHLKTAAAMAKRIDWLVSCDDGEECLHRRWAEEGLPEPAEVSK